MSFILDAQRCYSSLHHSNRPALECTAAYLLASAKQIFRFTTFQCTFVIICGLVNTLTQTKNNLCFFYYFLYLFSIFLLCASRHDIFLGPDSYRAFVCVRHGVNAFMFVFVSSLWHLCASAAAKASLSCAN